MGAAMQKLTKRWTCTDPNTQQYGRKLSNWTFEFKEGNIKEIIDLYKYSSEKVEPIINAYGYSLLPYKKEFIYSIYKNTESVNWIIAECIFEQLYSNIN